MGKQKTSFGQPDIVRLSDEDAAVELLERAVKGLWDVVNELTRFRRTTRQNYRVTIFGSARLKPATPAYNGVKKLAAELTKMGCDIISGGGPGLMQAANEGAHSVQPKALKRSVVPGPLVVVVVGVALAGSFAGFGERWTIEALHFVQVRESASIADFFGQFTQPDWAPARQWAQVLSQWSNGTTTKSPGRNDVTAAPTSSTSPTHSWPIVSPGVMSFSPR